MATLIDAKPVAAVSKRTEPAPVGPQKLMPTVSLADLRRRDELEIREQTKRKQAELDQQGAERVKRELKITRSLFHDLRKVDEVWPFMPALSRDLKDPDGMRMQLATQRYLASYYRVPEHKVHHSYSFYQCAYAK